jgi:inward rectifier potassium channel
VRRPGKRRFDGNIYLAMVRMPWRWYFVTVLLVYVIANLAFGSVYMAIGLEHLQGVEPDAKGARAFLHAFFLSAQTLTTVGYGHMAPKGLLMSAGAAFEAMLGIMLFALVCGVFYGRVARPSARIRFSANTIVAPYQGGNSLQFRMMNGRSTVLMQLRSTDSDDSRRRGRAAETALHRTSPRAEPRLLLPADMDGGPPHQ